MALLEAHAFLPGAGPALSGACPLGPPDRVLGGRTFSGDMESTCPGSGTPASGGFALGGAHPGFPSSAGTRDFLAGMEAKTGGRAECGSLLLYIMRRRVWSALPKPVGLWRLELRVQLRVRPRLLLFEMVASPPQPRRDRGFCRLVCSPSAGETGPWAFAQAALIGPVYRVLPTNVLERF